MAEAVMTTEHRPVAQKYSQRREIYKPGTSGVAANDDEPLPPLKSSGNAVIDAMRAQEIREAFDGIDRGQFEALYVQAMLDADGKVVAAFESASVTRYPTLAVTPALRERAVMDSRLIQEGECAASRYNSMAGILASPGGILDALAALNKMEHIPGCERSALRWPLH